MLSSLFYNRDHHFDVNLDCEAKMAYLALAPEGVRGGGTPLYWIYRYVWPKGYHGFSAVLVMNRVSILTILPQIWE